MIPARIVDGIKRYVVDKIPPGGFLMAVLENNLLYSFRKADSENLAALGDIVKYIYLTIPIDCWGSPERVSNWLNKEVGNEKD